MNGTCSFCGSFDGIKRIAEAQLCEECFARMSLFLQAPHERIIALMLDVQSRCDNLSSYFVVPEPNTHLMNINAAAEETLFLLSLLNANEVSEGTDA